MSSARQEAALLDLIEQDRRERCARIEAATAAQVESIRRTAHQEAQRRLRSALSQARERAVAAVAAAEAEAETRRRLQRQQADARFLHACRSALPAALRARWQTAATRLDWCRGALRQAHAALAQQALTVQHAAGLQAADIASLMAEFAALDLRFALTPSIETGLRVGCGHNCIDASGAGLCSDEDALAARLLSLRGTAP